MTKEATEGHGSWARRLLVILAVVLGLGGGLLAGCSDDIVARPLISCTSDLSAEEELQLVSIASNEGVHCTIANVRLFRSKVSETSNKYLLLVRASDDGVALSLDVVKKNGAWQKLVSDR